MEPKCEICGTSLAQAPLYRENPKGLGPAVWRCKAHLSEQPDQEVETLMDMIYEDKEDT